MKRGIAVGYAAAALALALALWSERASSAGHAAEESRLRVIAAHLDPRSAAVVSLDVADAGSTRRYLVASADEANFWRAERGADGVVRLTPGDADAVVGMGASVIVNALTEGADAMTVERSAPYAVPLLAAGPIRNSQFFGGFHDAVPPGWDSGSAPVVTRRTFERGERVLIVTAPHGGFASLRQLVLPTEARFRIDVRAHRACDAGGTPSHARSGILASAPGGTSLGYCVAPGARARTIVGASGRNVTFVLPGRLDAWQTVHVDLAEGVRRHLFRANEPIALRLSVDDDAAVPASVAFRRMVRE